MCGISSGQCNSLEELVFVSHGIIVAVESASVRADSRLFSVSLIDWCISPTFDSVSFTVTQVPKHACMS